ncbi:unnamed protein product [Alopecurus aequalis]
MALLSDPTHFMAIADKLSAGRLLLASPPINLLLLVGLLLVASVYLSKRRHPTVYLIDYACSEGIANCRVPVPGIIEHIHLNPFLDSKSISFMTRMLQTSGIGDESCFPPANFYIPPQSSFQDARACCSNPSHGDVRYGGATGRKAALVYIAGVSSGSQPATPRRRELRESAVDNSAEAELVVFPAIDDVLAKTGVAPDAIDVVVVNCSLVAPVPSISDMIVNRYRLRDGFQAVYLSGMGCSAGVISVDLAARLLQAAAARGASAEPRYALVVSTEIITPNFYTGKERAMQLSNVLFRVGGAAALLSTSDQGRARFNLSHLVRTSTAGTHDGSYSCVFQQEDDEGIVGVKLSRDLLNVAGEALKANITAIAPLVLPLSEQLRFVMSLAARRLRTLAGRHPKEPPAVPDFRKAFDHFCVHCGGRAVIDTVQRSLGLPDEQVEASRMTLRRFGNTSSSSVWYELAYIEAKRRMRKRDRVWMIGFGSGFKCNSAVWECIRPAEEPDRAWASCIHRYPMK